MVVHPDTHMRESGELGRSFDANYFSDNHLNHKSATSIFGVTEIWNNEFNMLPKAAMITRVLRNHVVFDR